MIRCQNRCINIIIKENDRSMNLLKEIQQIREMVRSEEKDRIASNHYFLRDGSVLAFPRGDGVTRQPYIYDGRMLWAYACGYL